MWMLYKVIHVRLSVSRWYHRKTMQEAISLPCVQINQPDWRSIGSVEGRQTGGALDEEWVTVRNGWTPWPTSSSSWNPQEHTKGTGPQIEQHSLKPGVHEERSRTLHASRLIFCLRMPTMVREDVLKGCWLIDTWTWAVTPCSSCIIIHSYSNCLSSNLDWCIKTKCCQSLSFFLGK